MAYLAVDYLTSPTLNGLVIHHISLVTASLAP